MSSNIVYVLALVFICYVYFYLRKFCVFPAYPDLSRLIHGNSSGIVKLIAEFKQFWQQMTAATAVASTSPSPAQDGKSEIPALETTTAAQSTPVTESETPRPRGFISKRQLDLAIHNIATYEKRADRKTCWYVKTSILQKYNLTDLPVPTQWVWLTRPDQQQRSVSETAAAAAAEGNSTISMETGCLDMPKCGVKRTLDAGIVGDSSPGNDSDASALPRKHAKMPPSTKSGKGKLWRMLREKCSMKNKQHTVQETSPASLKRETNAAAANDCIALNTEKIEMQVVTGGLQQINGADKRSPLSGLNANFAASKKQENSSPNLGNKVKVAGKKPGAAAQQSVLRAISKAIGNTITASFPVVMETVSSSVTVYSANSGTVESETDTKT
jgi:hypothetical protein